MLELELILNHTPQETTSLFIGIRLKENDNMKLL